VSGEVPEVKATVVSTTVGGVSVEGLLIESDGPIAEEVFRFLRKALERLGLLERYRVLGEGDEELKKARAVAFDVLSHFSLSPEEELREYVEGMSEIVEERTGARPSAVIVVADDRSWKELWLAKAVS
jgi:hypothetical protein